MEGTKILIIEDDHFLSDLYKNELENLGYQVIQARDGLDGLAKISAAVADFVLLDMVLPGLSGLEILKKIRSLGLTETLPVLVLTNVKDRQIIEESLKLGARGYILKTTTTPSLLAKEVQLLLRK